MSLPRNNPSMKRFTYERSFGGSAPPVRGATHERADPEIVFFIWSLSVLLLVFIPLVGGWYELLKGLLGVPLVATILTGLSSMGGQKWWAWTMAGLFPVFALTWLYMIG